MRRGSSVNVNAGDEAAAALGPGSLQWAVVHQLYSAQTAGLRGAVANGDSTIYVAGRAGVRRWSTVTGSSDTFLQPEAVPGVHALAVVGRSLWCCGSDGQVAVFDLRTGSKLKVGSLRHCRPERACGC